MRFFKKSIATGILFLCGMGFATHPAQAFWFGRRCDAQTCKIKFDDKCELVKAAKTECEEEYVNFYTLIDSLKSDLQILRDSQSVSENIFKQLQSAYESWRQDGFRIDTQSYTDYIVLKNKFSDQSSEIAEQKSIVASEMKSLGRFISSSSAGYNYISSLDDALDAFYDYSAAAARGAIPTEKE